MQVQFTVVALATLGALAAGRVLQTAQSGLQYLNASSAPVESLLSNQTQPRILDLQLRDPASDALWNKCKCKGEMLLSGMYASDEEAGKLLNPALKSAQSKWQNFPPEFENWGYTAVNAEEQDPELALFDSRWGVGNALRQNFVSDKTISQGGRNRLLWLTHWDPNAKDDETGEPIPKHEQVYYPILESGEEVERPQTGADFVYAMNPVEGVMMSLSRMGPKQTVEDDGADIEDWELPLLAQSSDISYGMWASITENTGNLPHLTKYFSLSITNLDTLAVMARAATDGILKHYPGERFTMDTENGKALLGTPNAVGLGYFLLQHKNQIGHKRVTAATIFACNRIPAVKDRQNEYPCLYYEIDAVPEKGKSAQDKPGADAGGDALANLEKRDDFPSDVDVNASDDAMEHGPKVGAKEFHLNDIGTAGEQSHELLSNSSYPRVFPNLAAPATDEVWNKCICKGAKLYEGMSGTDEEAGQLFDPPQDSARSRFQDFPLLREKWFYQNMDAFLVSAEYGDFDGFWGIGDALRYLRVSDRPRNQGGQHNVRFWSHWDMYSETPLEQQTYIVHLDNGEFAIRRATGAKFAYSFSPPDGVIIAMDRYGPKQAAAKHNLHIPDNELPELIQSSDISWGMWKSGTEGYPDVFQKNVRKYFSVSISNPTTLSIIAKCLTYTLHPNRLTPFPGHRFSVADSDAGKALLGTPNAVGIAYFLMQHKAELGNKRVTHASIFACARTDSAPCMYFEIENYTKPTPSAAPAAKRTPAARL